MRWSSGNYDFCAGLQTGPNELGTEWESAYLELHDLVNETEDSAEVYAGLVRIGGDALVSLVKRGTIPNWKEIDFNVASYDDGIETIKERARLIRWRIENDR